MSLNDNLDELKENNISIEDVELVSSELNKLISSEVVYTFNFILNNNNILINKKFITTYSLLSEIHQSLLSLSISSFTKIKFTKKSIFNKKSKLKNYLKILSKLNYFQNNYNNFNKYLLSKSMNNVQLISYEMIDFYNGSKVVYSFYFIINNNNILYFTTYSLLKQIHQSLSSSIIGFNNNDKLQNSFPKTEKTKNIQNKLLNYLKILIVNNFQNDYNNLNKYILSKSMKNVFIDMNKYAYYPNVCLYK